MQRLSFIKNPVRREDPLGPKQTLRDMLVHRDRRREGRRTGVRDPHHLQQALDRPVLPPATMQHDDGNLDTQVMDSLDFTGQVLNKT